jgi:hypothetical protein
MADRYDFAIDRDSAYEQLRARAEVVVPREAPAPAIPSSAPGRTTRGRKPPPSFAETFASSAARSIGSKLGREIVRGVLGSFFRGR